MKITIYELLGMIKDGKAPKEIMYKGHFLKFNEEDKEYYEDDEEQGYIAWLFNDYQIEYALNEEISIPIVKKEYKIEKIDQTLNRIDMNNDYYRYIMENRFKINEIIEVLNENNRFIK